MKIYHIIKQHDITDCGAACLATTSKQHGLKIPISKIREIAGTDRQGTNAYGLIKAAESLGFTAKGVKGDEQILHFPEVALFEGDSSYETNSWFSHLLIYAYFTRNLLDTL